MGEEEKEVEQTELLKAVYEQHWLHARHVENERLWFTNIFAVIVAGLLAFIFTSENNGTPNLFAVYGGLLILGLSPWRAPFFMRTEIAEKILRNNQLEIYSSFPPEYRKIKPLWISAHELFLYFYALIAAAGLCITLQVGLEYSTWWIGFIPSIILVFAWRGLRLPCRILLIQPINKIICFWRKPKQECCKNKKLMNPKMSAIWNILWRGLIGREEDMREIIHKKGK